MSVPLLILALVAAAASLLPAMVFADNWRRYAAPPPPHPQAPRISLLIPARNEAANIAACVSAALASQNVQLEVIVLDDGSTDATASIVADIATRDARLRLATSPPLPPGWCGKQHACWHLSQLASQPLLAFLDADVLLEPDGLSRATAFLHRSGAALISGVPRQHTASLLEKLLIPLIHFVLLGYLPLRRMRQSTSPAYGAGCGQLFITTRTGYDRAGGHAAIAASLHDGIMLPRAYRRAALPTDLFDATPIAHCRMYDSPAAVWNGLAKNATEAMASPASIVPWTLLLGSAAILPAAILVVAAARERHDALGDITLALAALGLAAGYAVRFAAAVRFRQSMLGALLHPLGVALLILIQWHALLSKLAGRSSIWRGRSYHPPA